MGKKKVGFELMSRKERRELGRKGALNRWAKVRAQQHGPQPFGGTMLDMMDVAGLTGR